LNRKDVAIHLSDNMMEIQMEIFSPQSAGK